MDLILQTTQTIGRKSMYNQDEVNSNLEKLFDVPKTARTVNETRGNIIPATKPIVQDDDNPGSTEKQSLKPKRVYTKKAPTRGGKREGSGRPKGSTNKITPTDMLDDFQKKAGMSFHEFINEQIINAYQAGDNELVSKYLLGFAKYLVQDVQEIKQDITSNGQTVGASFTFPNLELPEWKDDTTKH